MSIEDKVYEGVSDLKSFALLASEEPPSQLYHYTDLDGANGIITSKSLWLTKIQYLSDISELKLGINLFREVADFMASKIKDSGKKEFINTVSEQLGSSTETNICVASFCENGDLLSQWRAYGNSGNGVALGFSGKTLRQLSNAGLIHLWKCIYNKQQQDAIALDLVNLLLKLYDNIKKGISQNRVSDYLFTRELLFSPHIYEGKFAFEVFRNPFQEHTVFRGF